MPEELLSYNLTPTDGTVKVGSLVWFEGTVENEKEEQKTIKSYAVMQEHNGKLEPELLTSMAMIVFKDKVSKQNYAVMYYQDKTTPLSCPKIMATHQSDYDEGQISPIQKPCVRELHNIKLVEDKEDSSAVEKTLLAACAREIKIKTGVALSDLIKATNARLILVDNKKEEEISDDNLRVDNRNIVIDLGEQSIEDVIKYFDVCKRKLNKAERKTSETIMPVEISRIIERKDGTYDYPLGRTTYLSVKRPSAILAKFFSDPGLIGDNNQTIPLFQKEERRKEREKRRKKREDKLAQQSAFHMEGADDLFYQKRYTALGSGSEGSGSESDELTNFSKTKDNIKSASKKERRFCLVM